MEKLRNKVVSESEEAAKKPRFGLFSYSVPNCVGEDSAYKPAKSHVDKDGKVITEKRGFYIPTGVKKSSFQKYPEFIFPVEKDDQSSPKKNKVSKEGKENRPPFYLSVKKWNEYKMTKGKRLGQDHDYFSTTTVPPVPLYSKKDGKLITQPRGIYTSCTRLGKTARPFKDPLPEYFSSKEKTKSAPKPPDKNKEVYKSTAFPREYFSTNLELFFIDYDKLKQKKLKNIVQHEAKPPFRPANSMRGGLQGFFDAKIPALDPRTDLAKTKKVDKGAKKEKFKPTYNGLSVPTPSIILMNLKKD